MLNKLRESFESGLRLAELKIAPPPTEYDPRLQEIVVTPIAELETDLAAAEHAFQVVPETMDQYSTILLEGNLNIALKAILAGKGQDLRHIGGDWQIGIPKHTAVEGNNVIARNYAKAVAKIHHLSRYKATSDKRHLYPLLHKEAFNSAKDRLSLAMGKPKWRQRITKILAWESSPPQDGSVSNDPDYTWYLKHKKDFSAGIALQNKTLPPSEDKAQIAIENGVKNAVAKVWFETNLKSKRRHAATLLSNKFNEDPDSLNNEVLASAEIVGVTGGEVRAALGRFDNEYFNAGIYQILFPDYPQTWYDTPAFQEEPNIPLSGDMEPVGYVVVSELKRPDGKVWIQVAPFKQVGSQAIDGAAIVGATSQKSRSNWKERGVPGAQNTDKSSPLDLLINAALDPTERAKINGALTLLGRGTMTNPGRIIGPVAVGVLDVGAAQQTRLTDEQKAALLKGKWYDLDEVDGFINGPDQSSGLPRTNSPFREALSEVWRQRYAAEQEARQLTAHELSNLEDVLQEVREDPTSLLGFVIGTLINQLKTILKA